MRIIAAVLAVTGCAFSLAGEWRGSAIFWCVCAAVLFISDLQNRNEDE